MRTAPALVHLGVVELEGPTRGVVGRGGLPRLHPVDEEVGQSLRLDRCVRLVGNG